MPGVRLPINLMHSDRIIRSLLCSIVFLAVVFGMFLGFGYLKLEMDVPIPEQVPMTLALLLSFPLPVFRYLFPPPADCLSCPPTLPAIFATIMVVIVVHAAWIYAVISWRERREPLS